jgi:peptidoglycan biosynthesis protein MviN/MurJ (putative lipid II flippase)
VRPLAAINGILLGSVAAIAIGSAVTLLIVTLLREDHPRLEHEWRPLVKATLLFALATAAFAVAFVGHLRERRWRWLAQGVAVMAFTLLVAAFWPR